MTPFDQRPPLPATPPLLLNEPISPSINAPQAAGEPEWREKELHPTPTGVRLTTSQPVRTSFPPPTHARLLTCVWHTGLRRQLDRAEVEVVYSLGQSVELGLELRDLGERGLGPGMLVSDLTAGRCRASIRWRRCDLYTSSLGPGGAGRSPLGTSPYLRTLPEPGPHRPSPHTLTPRCCPNQPGDPTSRYPFQDLREGR